MAARKTATYGSWKSPVTGQVLTKGAALPTEVTLDGGNVYWLELRPEEGGRYCLCGRVDGRTEEVVPGPYNVRTRVHEYGGGSYVVDGPVVYFSNFEDQLVYRLERGGEPVPITLPGLRYADFVADSKRGRLVGVCEDHTGGTGLPVNSIASIATDGASKETLLSGNDFYSSPRIDPTGSKIAWATWNFPEMPWDGTELWVGELAGEGRIEDKELVAGGGDQSVMMPEWSPGGTLYFVSDMNGYWNLYRWTGRKPERMSILNADIGRPQWGFRMSSYAFDSDGKIAFTFCREGVWHLGVLDPLNKRIRPVRTSYRDIGYVRVWRGCAYFVGGSPTEPLSVVQVRLSDGTTRVIHRPGVPRFDGFISGPRHVEFATAGKKRAYALLYMPRNPDFRGPRGEKPPLIVQSHGGPTQQARTYLDFGIQYWTTRGFAVLDVNYGGSSGYGRKYRERLLGKWGVVDVDDCVNGALRMAKRGLVDGKRLIIRGGSAGGYTTLCALAFKQVFGAGASYYGVSDAEALAKETHKFESRYLDKLIAAYPEGKEIYRERSPIHFADRIAVPVIFFQGLEDVIVPPSQAETMVRSLRERGVPVAYLPFEEEQHGFRKAATIKRAREAELYFYSKVFGFSLPESVEPVEIMNAGGLRA